MVAVGVLLTASRTRLAQPEACALRHRPYKATAIANANQKAAPQAAARAVVAKGASGRAWRAAPRQGSRAAAAPPSAETETHPETSQAETSGATSTTAAAAAAVAAEAPAPAKPGVLGLSAEAVGKLCLLVVALCWGSYSPILRLLYSQDGPPGPVAIMLFRGVLQAIVLVVVYNAFGSKASSSSGSVGSSSGGVGNSSRSSNGNGAAPTAASAGLPQASPSSDGSPASDGSSLVPGWVQRISSRIPYTAIAATELGTWLFMATTIQTVGLQLTTATRAGFLIQATALLTPLLASFTGEKPSRNVWAGCMVALAGCLLIAADVSATDGDVPAAFSLAGDISILSSAFFFSLATVRLGTYARRIPSAELAAAKSVVLGTVALITFLVAAAGLVVAGEPLTTLWPGYTNPLSWTILIWTALGPGALAAFLHAKGQSVVPPAEAQVIFSTVPLWSVLFAFLLLGGEPMSEKTFIGGAAVVAAGLIASRKEAGSEKAGKQA